MPNTRSAAHGAIHRRNFGSEQRSTPRAMKRLSTDVLLSSSRPRGGGDFAHPGPLRAVIDLGLRIELFEQPEALGRRCLCRHGARSIVEIAEVNGAGRAGL